MTSRQRTKPTFYLLAVLAVLCLLVSIHGTALGQGAVSPEESLVRAYAAAWNLGDSNAVAALFAPNAEVRQRAPWIEDGGDRAFIRDTYGAETAIYFSALTFRGADIIWAASRVDVALWAAELLRDGHRIAVDSIRTTGNGRVSWTYHASTHAQRRVLGVQPTVGYAEATVTDGLLRTLTIESDVASVQDRIRRIWAAFPGPQNPTPQSPVATPPTFSPTVRFGPEDGDSRRIVTGSAAALVVLAVAGTLRSRTRR